MLRFLPLFISVHGLMHDVALTMQHELHVQQLKVFFIFYFNRLLKRHSLVYTMTHYSTMTEVKTLSINNKDTVCM